MQLSPHFALSELVASQKAAQLGIDNTPPPELLPRLVRVAEMLERIRSTLNVPITVTSGYRCNALNTAVGSRNTSDHPQGHAVDFVAPGFGTPTEIAKILAPLVDALGIGQILLEGVKGKQWVHVSTHAPENAINRVLTITDAGTVPGIIGLA
ncbi:MAG: peptidase M15A [Pseudomonadota bacterium]|nr:peptidase M15A [Pseudomonadota bacterium]